MHGRMFSSIPTFYPLDATNVPLGQPKVSPDFVKCPLGRAKSTLVESVGITKEGNPRISNVRNLV